MPIKSFSYESAAQQDASGVFITLPAVPVEAWPIEVSANGLQLWDDYAIAGQRLSLPDDAIDWHIAINFWGESADGIALNAALGDFVTKDSMRTFSSFMMLGIQTAFGIQCSEADAILQAQQQSNALQAQIAELKESAVQRDAENSPEYQNLLAENQALLAGIADLRTKTYTDTPVSGSVLTPVNTPTGSASAGFYVADFWSGVKESATTLNADTDAAAVIERLRTL